MPPTPTQAPAAIHFPPSSPPASRLHERELRILASVLSGDWEDVEARGGPDWRASGELAVRHGLAPLLFQRGRAAAERWPQPPEVAKRLRDEFLVAAVEAKGLIDTAARVIGGLEAAGIPVAALKGLHLATSVYENPAFRSMTDIDLLVPADRRDAARAVLVRDGWLAEGEDDPTLHHAARMAKARAVPIELHHDLCPDPNPFRMRVEPLWERMVPITVGGRRALGLAAEDLVLHLCVHLAYNHRCLVPLRTVYDVAMVLERAGPAFDWRRLEEEVMRTGTRRAVFCGLALAREMFGAGVPAKVLERLVPDADAHAALDVAWENVMSFAAAGPGWIGVAMGDGRPSRTMRGFLARVFAPPSRLMETGGRAVSLPRLAWIYLTRPVVLLIRHRELVMALLRGRPGARAQLHVARTGAALHDWIVAEPPTRDPPPR